MPTPRPSRPPRPPHPRRQAGALAGCAAALLLLVAGGPAATAAPAPTAALPLTAAAPLPTAPGLDPATMAKLDAAIAAEMDRADIPGVNVGLWLPGRGQYVKSFGVADTRTRTPLKTDMYTRIGSVTKTFTVTAVLQLADRGLVALDDPISKYVGGVPGGGHITVRQLAAMRSGLHDYTGDEKFIDSLRADPHRSYTPRQLLGYAFAHGPDFAPGGKWEYSNTNTVLLGLLVEKASGLPLSDYLRLHVLDPLGLSSTTLPDGAALPSPHAHGYTTFSPHGTVTDATDWNPSWAWAAGAMTSDLADLHAWVPALVGGTLLKPGTQAARLRTQPVGYPGVSYGLGIAEVDGWLGHNGELPGYETVAAGLPATSGEDAGAVLVVLVNSDVDRGGSLSTRIAKAVTGIATPHHVWNLPSPPQTGEQQH